MARLLDQIESPADVKRLDLRELSQICHELREEIRKGKEILG